MGSQQIVQHSYQRCFAYAEQGDFSVGGQAADEARQTVGMRLVTVGGKLYLSEEVPFEAVQKSAPDAIWGAATMEPPASLAAVPPARPTKLLKHITSADGVVGRVARPRRQPGHTAFVMDYIDYFGAVKDAIFRSGVTYYISSELAVSNSLTIEAGSVVKLATNAQVTLVGSARIVNLSSPLNAAIFTSAYDTNVGEVIFSGDPNAYKYAAGLALNAVSNDLRGVKIRYAKKGIDVSGGPNRLADLQFTACDKAVQLSAGSGTATVFNCLIAQGSNGVSAATNTLVVRSCTFDQVGSTALAVTTGVGSLVVIDSFFASVTNIFDTNTTVGFTFTSNAVMATGSRTGSRSHPDRIRIQQTHTLFRSPGPSAIAPAHLRPWWSLCAHSRRRMDSRTTAVSRRTATASQRTCRERETTAW